MEETKGQSQPYRANDYELATRLSLFLNGSIPDATLLNWPTKKTFPTAHTVRANDRLMNSSPSIALGTVRHRVAEVQQIEEQQTGELNTHTNRAQYDELLFFDELFRANHSLLDIVQSDWIFVSRYSGYDKVNLRGAVKEDLRITWPRGPSPVPSGRASRASMTPTCKLFRERYGGVISSAAIIRITSAPERTSPVGEASGY